MAFVFKKQIFGWQDMLRFKHLTKKRKEMIESASTTPLPTTYKVNEVAKSLHPKLLHVMVVATKTLSHDTKMYTLNIDPSYPEEHFPYFRPGQYVSVSMNIRKNRISRPYAIVSSPAEALKGIMRIAVKKTGGIMSTYFFNSVHKGDKFTISGACGNFYYEPLRDTKDVLFVAGGSGITPFISMAHDFKDTKADVRLTILYGSKTKEDILFYDELETLKSKNCKVIHVLSDEKLDGFHHGFIDRVLLERYIGGRDVTVFASGSENMYAFLRKELQALSFPDYRLHLEANPAGTLPETNYKTYRAVITIRDRKYYIKTRSNETLLTAMERANIAAPNHCRSGSCGYCHSKLVSGDIYIPESKDGRRLADLKFGYIHPCVTYPRSDVKLIVPFQERK